MARYDEQHKAQTRARVVDAAGKRLKRDGIDGSGVSALMSDAGLTNGAFYAHFKSKDDLVAVAVQDQLKAQLEMVRGLPDDALAIRTFIDAYLSADHRDHPDAGCPSAALVGDISRSNEVVREAYTHGLEAVVELVATRTRIEDAGEARTAALSLLASLVGTVQMSRAVTDPALSQEFLAAGRENALRLLGDS